MWGVPVLSRWSSSSPATLPKAKLWGNDVSLYSGVLGAYLAGQPFRLDVQEEKFAWLEPYLADEEAKAATVMVLFEMLKYEKAKNLVPTSPLGALHEHLRRLPPCHG